MGIGLGIVLLLAGLILALDVVNVGTEFVDEGALGWILILVGVLSIVLALVMNRQRAPRGGGGAGTVVDQRQPPPQQPPQQPPPQDPPRG
ncbi:hypothetical protein KUV85_11470 [Nocardioides panacisoli]|uniref:DUF6458 family protein n=1 Tax=Nocardioides panacisoli TaxID=627624 RepID=UPI001C628B02|nr:DUF6458 family protein [Nocardioides panacisoli]QYJ02953.1 hypothetical protein KUV85_11470 [Nocardioides panacisoli]